jgi:hypothetical protein
METRMRKPGTRKLWGLLLLSAAAWGGLAGCGGGGSTEPAFGCATGDRVPSGVRKAVEAAAGTFRATVKTGDLRPIYANAATAAKSARSEGEFLGPISGAARQIGIPEHLKTEELAAVRFGEAYPYRDEVACPVEGEDQSLVLKVTNFPEQAILVQSGESKGERYYYSTLWHREEAAWRLAGFYAKPATYQGKDWSAYADEARSQREAKHDRNAALLYNVAMDLAIPNVWMHPPELETLRREQARISVEHLPVGAMDPWPDGPDTFYVFNSAYAALPQLAVVFRYKIPPAVTDSVALGAYSERLHKYVTAQFPEYAEVFSALVLQGVHSQREDRGWTTVYPLKKEE